MIAPRMMLLQNAVVGVSSCLMGTLADGEMTALMRSQAFGCLQAAITVARSSPPLSS
jgi:hypothetical protein